MNFKLNTPPSLFSNYQIRGQIVFFKEEVFNDSVIRCINHQQQGKNNICHECFLLLHLNLFYGPLDIEHSHPHASHVLRCDDASSSYHVHENRHSVVIALKQPAPGCQHVSLCFRFMCYSWCFGAWNRRQTKLVFTLENLRCVFFSTFFCCCHDDMISLNCIY